MSHANALVNFYGLGNHRYTLDTTHTYSLRYVLKPYARRNPINPPAIAKSQ
jgi:hypothetical protein